MHRKLLFLYCLMLALGLHAQVHTGTFDPDIKTLKAERVSSPTLERPFLVLQDGLIDGSDPENTLHISFDA